MASNLHRHHVEVKIMIKGSFKRCHFNVKHIDDNMKVWGELDYWSCCCSRDLRCPLTFLEDVPRGLS